MITSPGIYDLSHEAYHADPCPSPSLSAGSAIELLQQSPEHAWSQHPRNPNRIERASTKAMDRGSLMHELLIGKGAGIVQIDADSYRTKAAQEARDAAYSADKTPVLIADLGAAIDALDEISAKLESHAMLSDLAAHDVRPEVSMFWQDGDVWCRARPDNLFADIGVCVDFKFTGKSALSWGDGAVRRGDHIRAAHYMAGVRALTGAKSLRYLFVVCETAAPYGVVVHEFDGASLELGDRLRERAVDTWRTCLATETWPSYPQQVNLMALPAWAMRDLMEDEDVYA